MTILIISGIWGGITSGVKQIVSFVSSGVRRGLGQEETYEQIKDYLPDDIIEDVIAGQYNLFEEFKTDWARINTIPDEYIVGREYGLATSLDYRQNYIMRIKVAAYDFNTGEEVERWITVESNKELTLEEWQSSAIDAARETLAGTDLFIEDYLEYEYFIKQGI